MEGPGVIGLKRRLAALCDETVAGLPPGPARARLEEVRDRLAGPLRVAVVGRVKAGKSTLVNALLGQRVARTDVQESTAVVTWFRYGYPERIVVRPRDGTPWDARFLPGGTLPASLGVDASAIESVVVHLSNEALRGLTLIDTPGLGSADVERSQRTEAFLALDRRSRDAVAEADALVLVLSGRASADDLRALGDPVAAAEETTRPEVVAVLTKVDRLAAPTEDPWPAAEALAAEEAARLGSRVKRVVPVMGLLAETSGSGVFTERDAHLLRQLAELAPGQRAAMLLSPERFLTRAGPLEEADRERLLALLDLHGISGCLGWIDGGIRDASGLARAMLERSGIELLRTALAAAFAERSDALTVDRALMELGRAAAGVPLEPPMAELLDRVESMRLDGETHIVAASHALRGLDAVADAPADLAAELRVLVAGEGPETVFAGAGGDLRAEAAHRAARWRAVANEENVRPPVAVAAWAACRAYELMWRSLAREPAG